ncbi:MAG: GFA family protein [Betaproteobacteria bacterium]|nr:GFA family protein [Betaproteobacteria bacterium]
MHVDGGCHCGNITYEAQVDPARVSICHCTDCQQLTGTAYRVNVRVRAQDLVLRGGAPKVYVKTAESGNKRAHAFCPECGTPLYSTSIEPNPQSYGLRVGTIRQRAQLPPQAMGWCCSAMPWTMNIDALPKTATQLQR